MGGILEISSHFKYSFYLLLDITYKMLRRVLTKTEEIRHLSNNK